MGGSNVLAQTFGMLLCSAVALSALLAMDAANPRLWLGEPRPVGSPAPRWQPWLVLVTLAAASVVGAVLYPLPAAAAFG